MSTKMQQYIEKINSIMEDSSLSERSKVRAIAEMVREAERKGEVKGMSGGS